MKRVRKTVPGGPDSDYKPKKLGKRTFEKTDSLICEIPSPDSPPLPKLPLKPKSPVGQRLPTRHKKKNVDKRASRIVSSCLATTSELTLNPKYKKKGSHFTKKKKVKVQSIAHSADRSNSKSDSYQKLQTVRSTSLAISVGEKLVVRVFAEDDTMKTLAVNQPCKVEELIGLMNKKTQKKNRDDDESFNSDYGLYEFHAQTEIRRLGGNEDVKQVLDEGSVHKLFKLVYKKLSTERDDTFGYLKKKTVTIDPQATIKKKSPKEHSENIGSSHEQAREDLLKAIMLLISQFPDPPEDEPKDSESSDADDVVFTSRLNSLETIEEDEDDYVDILTLDFSGFANTRKTDKPDQKPQENGPVKSEPGDETITPENHQPSEVTKPPIHNVELQRQVSPRKTQSDRREKPVLPAKPVLGNSDDTIPRGYRPTRTDKAENQNGEGVALVRDTPNRGGPSMQRGRGGMGRRPNQIPGRGMPMRRPRGPRGGMRGMRGGRPNMFRGPPGRPPARGPGAFPGRPRGPMRMRAPFGPRGGEPAMRGSPNLRRGDRPSPIPVSNSSDSNPTHIPSTPTPSIPQNPPPDSVDKRAYLKRETSLAKLGITNAPAPKPPPKGSYIVNNPNPPRRINTRPISKPPSQPPCEPPVRPNKTPPAPPPKSLKKALSTTNLNDSPTPPLSNAAQSVGTLARRSPQPHTAIAARMAQFQQEARAQRDDPPLTHPPHKEVPSIPDGAKRGVSQSTPSPKTHTTDPNQRILGGTFGRATKSSPSLKEKVTVESIDFAKKVASEPLYDKSWSNPPSSKAIQNAREEFGDLSESEASRRLSVTGLKPPSRPPPTKPIKSSNSPTLPKKSSNSPTLPKKPVRPPRPSDHKISSVSRKKSTTSGSAKSEVLRVYFKDETWRSFVVNEESTTVDLFNSISTKYSEVDLSDHAIFHVTGRLRQRLLDPHEKVWDVFSAFKHPEDKIVFKHAEDVLITKKEIIRIYFTDNTYKCMAVSPDDTVGHVIKHLSEKLKLTDESYSLFQMNNDTKESKFLMYSNYALDLKATWPSSCFFLFSNELHPTMAEGFIAPPEKRAPLPGKSIGDIVAGKMSFRPDDHRYGDVSKLINSGSLASSNLERKEQQIFNTESRKHREVMRKHAFCQWLDFHLSNSQYSINDLEKDISDGVVLIKVIEIVSGNDLGSYFSKPTMLIHEKLENISLALNWMSNSGIHLGGCTAEDILDGNVNFIMDILWPIIYLSISKPFSPKLTEPMAKQQILHWVNQSIKGYTRGGNGLKASNLEDDWKDGLLLSALLASHSPTSSFNLLEEMETRERIETVIEKLEEEYKVPEMIKAGELMSDFKPDDKSIFAFLSVLQLVFE